MRFEETIGVSHFLKITEHHSRQKIDETLSSLGLTMPQYSVLSILESGVSRTGADLARACFVSPQTMNRILQNLEKLELVRKVENPSHGLKLDYVCTPKAVKIVCKAHVLVNEIELEMINNFSKKEVSLFQELLQKCFENLKKS